MVRKMNCIILSKTKLYVFEMPQRKVTGILISNAIGRMTFINSSWRSWYLCAVVDG